MDSDLNLLDHSLVLNGPTNRLTNLSASACPSCSVSYNLAAVQSVFPSANYPRLFVSGAAVKTLTGTNGSTTNITAVACTVATGSTLSLGTSAGANALTVSGGTSLVGTLAFGAKAGQTAFLLGDLNSASATATGGLTMNAASGAELHLRGSINRLLNTTVPSGGSALGGTVFYDASADQEMYLVKGATVSSRYFHLVLDGSGTKTLLSDVSNYAASASYKVFAINGNLTVNPGITLNFGDATSTITTLACTTAAAVATINGTVNYGPSATVKTFTITSGLAGAPVFNMGSTVAHRLAISGSTTNTDLTISPVPLPTALVTYGGTTQTVYGTNYPGLSISSGTKTLQGNTWVQGTLTVATGGNFVLGANRLTSGSAAGSTGAFAVTGSLGTTASSALEILGTNSPTISLPISITNLGDLIINKTGTNATVSFGAYTTPGLSINIADSLYIANGTFSIGTTTQAPDFNFNTLIVNGILTNGSGAGIKNINVAGNVSGTGTINLAAGTGATTLTLNGVSNSGPAVTTIAASEIVYGLAGNQSMLSHTSLLGDLRLTGSGIKSAAGSVTMTSGLLTVDAGATLDLPPAAVLTLSNTSGAGTGTISGSASSGLAFTGTLASAFTPTVAPGFGSVTLNKTGATGSNYVTTSRDINTNSLVLTDGKISVIGGSIILAAGSVMPTGAAGTYIAGPISYTITGNTTGAPANVTFPLGISVSSDKFTPFAVKGIRQGATTTYTASAPASPGSTLSGYYTSPPVAVSANNYYVLSPSVMGNLTGSGAGIDSVRLKYLTPDANLTAIANTTIAQLNAGAWANRGAAYSFVNPNQFLTSTTAISSNGSSFVFALGEKAAGTIYVRTDGDDNNSGISNTTTPGFGAKKTLTAGIAALCQGCSLSVAAGDYSETAVVNKDIVLQGPGTGTALVSNIVLANTGQVLITNKANISLTTDKIYAPAHGFLTGERLLMNAQAGTVTLSPALSSNTGSATSGVCYAVFIHPDTFMIAQASGVVYNITATTNVAAAKVCVPFMGQLFALSFTRAPALSGRIFAYTVTVPTNGHIGTGIALARETGTVNIGAGHFYQKIILSKGITLNGAGKYSTVLDGNSGNASGLQGLTLNDGANDVYLKNFKIEEFNNGLVTSGVISLHNLNMSNMAISRTGNYGIAPVNTSSFSGWTIDSCSLDSNGVRLQNGVALNQQGRGFMYQGSGVSLTNLVIKNSTANYNALIGIDLNAGVTFENILLDNNTLTNNGDAGYSLTLSPHSGNVTVSNSVINMGWNSWSRLQTTGAQRWGIELKDVIGNGNESGAGSIAILRNTIAQSDRSTASSLDNAGIAIDQRPTSGATAGIVVAYNHIIGVRGSASACVPSNYQSDGFGIVLSGTGHKIYNNIISDCEVGLQFQQGDGSIFFNATANQCSLNGTNNIDFFDRDASTLTANNVVKYNSFLGNDLGFRNVNADGATNSQLADVSGNWWGAASGPFNATYNNSGSGQPAINSLTNASYTSARIAISPWLKADPDDDLNTIGVQVNSAKTYLAGGTQAMQRAVSNLALAQNFVSSTYQDVVELGSNYASRTNENFTKAVKFNLDGNGEMLDSLKLNNADAVITLTGPVSLSSYLNLAAGSIKSQGNSLFTLRAKAKADTGTGLNGSDRAGFIAGPVAVYDSVSTARRLIFPIGVSGIGKRYAVLRADQANDTTTLYTLKPVDSSAAGLNYTLPASLSRVSSGRYYTLSRDVAGPLDSMQVTLSYGSDEGINEPDSLRIAGEQLAGAWSDLGGVGSAAVSGTIKSGFFTSLPATFALANAVTGQNLPPFLYVNPVTGNDSYTGRSATFVSGSTGPKRSISAALAVAEPYGKVYLAGGSYGNLAANNVTLTQPVALNLTPGTTGPARNFTMKFSASAINIAAPLPDSGDIAADSVTLFGPANSIAEAMSITKSAGFVKIPAGQYNEDIVITKSLSLLGAKLNLHGTNPARNSGETILSPATSDNTDGNVITVNANNVKINGFTIDGDNGFAAARGIATGTNASAWPNTVSGLDIRNNIVRDLTQQGIQLNGPGTSAATGNVITRNLISHITAVPSGPYNYIGNTVTYEGRGVLLRNNQYADITNNTIENAFNPVYTRDFNLAGSGKIKGNRLYPAGPLNASVPDPDLAVVAIGVLNVEHGDNSSFTVSYDTVFNYSNLSNPEASSYMTGFQALDISGNAHLAYDTNKADGAPGLYFAGNAIGGTGYLLFNCTSSDTLSITGGKIGSDARIGTGVSVQNRYYTAADSNAAGAAFYNITRLRIDSADYGVHISDKVSANITVTMTADSIMNSSSNMLQTNAGGVIADKANKGPNIFITVDQCLFDNVKGRALFMQEPNTTTIRNNTISNSGNLAVGTNGDINTIDQTFTGYPIVIQVNNNNAETMGHVTITNNTISACTTASALCYFQRVISGYATPGVFTSNGLRLSNNNFGNNASVPVIKLQNANTLVEASGNYWGAVDQTTVNTRAAAGSTLLDYNGWLNSGYDISAAPGFQANFDTVYVSQTGGGTHITTTVIQTRFNEGLDMLNEGGTLILTSPTVTPTAFTGAVVNKNLVLKNATSIAAASPVAAITMNGAGKTMQLGSDLVLSTLALTDGFVDTNGFRLTVPATGVSGGSADSYVKGPLTLTSAVAATTYTFPVGTTGSYRPLSFTAQTSAAANNFTAEVFDAAAPAYTLPAGIDKVSPFRYFRLSRGTSAATFTSGTPVLNYSSTGSPDDQVSDPVSLRILSDLGSAAAYTSLGGFGSLIGSGSITATSPLSAFAQNTSMVLAIANATAGSNFSAISDSLYVDFATGNDNNNGSAAFPLKTMQKAIDTTIADGTIFVVGPNTFTRANFYKALRLTGAGAMNALIDTVILAADLDDSSAGLSFNTVTLGAAGHLNDALQLSKDGAVINTEGGSFIDSVTITKNLSINNTGSAVSMAYVNMNGAAKTLNLIGDFNIGSLAATLGDVDFGNNTLTLGKFSGAGGFLLADTGASLNITGSGNLVSALPFKTGSAAFKNLSLNLSGGVAKLGNSITLSGALTLNNGVLDLNSFNLGLSGSASVSGSGALRVSNLSDLVISGTGPFGNLAFDQSSVANHTLKSLTLSRGATGTLTLGSNLKVQNTDITGKLVIAENTLEIYGNFTGTGSFSGGPASKMNITGSGSFSLRMDATTPGYTNQLYNLDVARGVGAALTLNSNLYIGNSLGINNTNLALNGKKLALNGLATQSGTSKIISSAGSVLAIGGAGVNGTLSFSTASTAAHSLDSLIINKDGVASDALFATSVIVSNLVLSKGVLAIAPNTTLTLNGTYTPGYGYLRGSATSDLLISSANISGIGFDQSLPGSTNALGDFVMAGSATFAPGNNLYVADTFDVPTGSVFNINGKGLTLAGLKTGAGFLSPGSGANATAADNVAKLSSLTLRYAANISLTPYAPGAGPLSWASRFGTLSIDIGSGNLLTPVTGLTYGPGAATPGTGLKLISGTIDWGTKTAIIDGPVVYNDGGIYGSSTSFVTANSGAAGTYLQLSGGTAATHQLKKLTINTTGTNTLTIGSKVIADTVAVTSGYLGLADTLSVDSLRLGSAKIQGSATASLLLTGSGKNYNLNMDVTTPGTTNRLNNLNLSDATSFSRQSTDLVVSGALSLTGKHSINSFTLTIGNTLFAPGNDRLTGSATSNLSYTGTGAYTLPLSQTVPGTSNVLRNLSITKAATVVSMSGPVTLGGTLSLTGKLGIGSNALQLNATSATGGTGLIGSATSVLNIGGTGTMSGSGLGFDSASADNYKLASLYMNRPSGAVLMRGRMNILGNISTLKGVLTDTTGVIDISDTSTVVETDSTNSRVVGYIRTVRNFPVAGNLYNTGMGLTINAENNPLGNGTTIIRGTLPAGRSLPHNVGFLTGKSIARYYDLYPTVSGPKHAHLYFTYMDAEQNVFTDTDLRRLYRASLDSGFNAANPGWVSYAGSVVSTNTFYNEYPVQEFSRITLGGDSLDPLPVTLLSFNAVRSHNAVELNWATATEQNAAYFEVQRSTDGRTFEAIGKVAAAGNSLSLHNYSFTDFDEVKSNGTVYYRLRQTDLSEAFVYSAVRSVDFGKQAMLLQAMYPNPARNELNLLINSSSDTRLQIFDLTGRMVMDQNLSENTALHTISLAGLVPGLYNVYVFNGSQQVSKKLRVE
ncbi:MAG: T9SS type A sorting domain-containing protein [Bacteroidota bacterium]